MLCYVFRLVDYLNGLILVMSIFWLSFVTYNLTIQVAFVTYNLTIKVGMMKIWLFLYIFDTHFWKGLFRLFNLIIKNQKPFKTLFLLYCFLSHTSFGHYHFRYISLGHISLGHISIKHISIKHICLGHIHFWTIFTLINQMSVFTLVFLVLFT